MPECRVCSSAANPFNGYFEAAFLRQYGICEDCFIKFVGHTIIEDDLLGYTEYEHKYEHLTWYFTKKKRSLNLWY